MAGNTIGVEIGQNSGATGNGLRLVAPVVLTLCGAERPLLVQRAGRQAHGVAMILGTVMLVDTEVPELTISWGTAVAVTVPFVAITAFLLRLAVRSFRLKIETGSEGLVGEIGVAKTEIAGTGRVFVHGELWNAVSPVPIPEGARVRVAKVEGLRVEVESVEE